MVHDLDQRIAAAGRELDSVLEDVRACSAREGRLPRAHYEALSKMEETVWVDTHWDIAWPTWPAGLRAKAVAVGQKIVRAVVAWYVDRILQDQNRYNFAVYQTVRVLSEEIQELRLKQARDHARIEMLSTEMTKLRQSLADTEVAE